MQQAKRSAALISCGLAAAGLINSCKTGNRSSLAEAPQAALAGGGLDVNDVSILFPLPPDLNSSGDMLPLSTLNAAGAPLMSEALFHDVLGHFKYSSPVGPLNAGIDFRGVSNPPLGRPVRTGQGPFDTYSDWHIVAMRYDPCAPGPSANLLHQSPGTFPTAFDAAKCSPQLRMTAQPLMTAARASAALFEPREWLADPTPRAADYSMHLVFALTPEDSAALYADLRAFRDHCGNITAGLPLAIHPCLVSEVLQGQTGGAHFKELQQIIQKYAKTYTGISSMGTRNGDDPWLFMNGLVDHDAFSHQQIAAIAKTDHIKRNAKGAMLEPFQNGYYQMMSFLQVTPASGAGFDPTKTSITPEAVPNSVNTFFHLELNSAPNTPEFIAKVNQVEDPASNDFFSTDCVTCHGAAEMAARSVGGMSAFQSFNDTFTGSQDFRGPFLGTVANGEPNFDHDRAFAQFTPKFQDSSFFKLAGYTNIVQPKLLTQSTFNVPYAVVQFGYRGVAPAISNRNTNESAKVAKEANDFYGQGQAPAGDCPTEKMRSCLYQDNIIAWTTKLADLPLNVSRYVHLYASNYCLSLLCPERAKATNQAFGSYAFNRYELQDDLPISDVNQQIAAQKLIVPKGTVILGAMIEVPTSFFDPSQGTTTILTTPDLVPAVSTNDQSKSRLRWMVPLPGDSKNRLKKL